MMRYMTLLVLLAGTALGCRAPVPSVSTLLSPYGSTRVPPPSTSSFGKPDAYYQGSLPQGAAPTARVGARDEPLVDVTLDPNQQARNVAPVSNVNKVSSQSIGQVAARVPTPDAGQLKEEVRAALRDASSGVESQIRVVEQSAGTRETAPLRLSGMPVHDATAAPNSSAAVPSQASSERLIKMSQLPPGTLPNALIGRQIRGLSVGSPAATSPSGTPRSTNIPGYVGAGGDSEEAVGWRSRFQRG